MYQRNKLGVKALTLSIALFGGLGATEVLSSSHREAPFISTMPRLDGTDFYMFRSYETGREDYVTFIANYYPLQDAYGGPNYFDLEKNARYEIHIDNDGDANQDITFRFRFRDNLKDLQVPVGDEMVSVPLKNIGQIGASKDDTSALNAQQTFRVDMVEGHSRRARGHAIRGVDNTRHFLKPVDNIGNKSIPDYEAYARDHIYDVDIPNCDAPGRVFVGQRKEGFAVNLGEVFDLVNLNPLQSPDASENIIADKNITSIAMEVPISCITEDDEPVIGAWTTASIPQGRLINPRPNFDRGYPAKLEGGAFIQVSRLGMPLVNEVIIGLKDKDRFNASHPRRDSQFATYVTNPTLPELLEILFPGTAVAPNMFPRTDLVTAFLTGLPGLNQPANVRASEMLRLNTAVASTQPTEQSNLGALGGDLAGFPNGRRPGDDVVDIALRVAMGALIADPDIAPNNTAPLTDGATVSEDDFDTEFPYLVSPVAGSPNPINY